MEATIKKSWEDVNKVLYFQGLSYVPEILCADLISWHHNDLLGRPFGIEKIGELVARKYYWPTLHHNVEAYVKSYDICLASKVVRHKLYRDL